MKVMMLYLDVCGLDSLSDRTQQNCQQCGLKNILYPIHLSMFPVNPQLHTSVDTRNKEHFLVNKAKTDSNRNSAIPYIQRLLNDYVWSQKRDR